MAILVFLTLRIIPGDPVELMLGESALPAQREQLKEKLGIHKPFSGQFIDYLKILSKFELGRSLTQDKPVHKLVFEHYPYTFLLAVCAVVFAAALSIPAGIWCAYKPSSFFSTICFFVSVVFLSLPTFWLGPLLIVVFSLRWPWLPLSSFKDWTGLILPTLTLGVGMWAVLVRTISIAATECMRAEYINTARAKGASELRVLFIHVFPNTLIPILTIIGLQLGHLLGGAVITEAIFNWPGIGTLAYEAILQRDYNTVQGVVLVIALSYVLINLFTDLINRKLTPLES